MIFHLHCHPLSHCAAHHRVYRLRGNTPDRWIKRVRYDCHYAADTQTDKALRISWYTLWKKAQQGHLSEQEAISLSYACQLF